MGDTPYFRLFPSDFLNGIGGLSADQIAAYTVVLMLIFDRQAPIQEDIDGWAWRLRMRRDRCERAVNDLVALGKLDRSEGNLFNRRAGKEIDYRQRMSRKASENAHDRWSKPELKSNENNDTAMQPHCDRNAIPESIVHSPQSIPSSTEDGSDKNRKRALDSNVPSLVETSPKPKRKIAVPWPEGFGLDTVMRQDAVARGVPIPDVDRVFQAFRDYHQAKGSTFRDWRAAWRTWAGNHNRFGPRGGAPAPARGVGNRYNTPSGFAPAIDAGINLMRKIDAEEGVDE